MRSLSHRAQALVAAAVVGSGIVLVLGQMWLKQAQESGSLGRTPGWAVFLPLVVWIMADVCLACLATWNRRRSPVLALAFGGGLLLSLGGTVVAWNAVSSFLRVA